MGIILMTLVGIGIGLVILAEGLLILWAIDSLVNLYLFKKWFHPEQ